MKRRILQWIIVVGISVVSVLALRYWWWEVFKVPTESMVPTFLVNDRVLTNKMAYKTLTGSSVPQKGDVVVFVHPKDQRLYIKRVIGQPNDRVLILGPRVWVNGELLETATAGKSESALSSVQQTNLVVSNVQLSNGRSYRTVVSTNPHQMWNMSGYWIVAPNHIFVLGDWRDHSSDSREWGDVPLNNVVGRAQCYWGDRMSFTCQGL